MAREDRWTLNYMNILHLQPIVEAIDDDDTGFISIMEVNAFVSAKPEDWR